MTLEEHLIELKDRLTTRADRDLINDACAQIDRLEETIANLLMLISSGSEREGGFCFALQSIEEIARKALGMKGASE